MDSKEILDLYNSGKREEAFGEIVKAYSERLYWHVRGLILSHDDADDLLQEIFMKIWAALPSFRGDSQLFTWIYRIATNETLNFIKKKKLRAALSFTSLDAPDAAAVSSDPYFNGDEAEMKLQKAIAKLPPKQRAVFTLRYYDEMSYEEISRVLGTSVGALKASFHFAQEKIRKYLE